MEDTDSIVFKEVQHLAALGFVPQSNNVIQEIVELFDLATSQIDKIIRRIEEVQNPVPSADGMRKRTSQEWSLMKYLVAVTDSASSSSSFNFPDYSQDVQQPEFTEASNQITTNLERANNLMLGVENYLLDVAERYKLIHPEALQVVKKVYHKGYRIILNAGTAYSAGRELASGNVSQVWSGTVAVANIIVDLDEMFKTITNWRASGATANLAEAAEQLQDQKTKLADENNNIKSMFCEE